jgi:hypothetical protein
MKKSVFGFTRKRFSIFLHSIRTHRAHPWRSDSFFFLLPFHPLLLFTPKAEFSDQLLILLFEGLNELFRLFEVVAHAGVVEVVPVVSQFFVRLEQAGIARFPLLDPLLLFGSQVLFS